MDAPRFSRTAVALAVEFAPTAMNADEIENTTAPNEDQRRRESRQDAASA
jgi:hypothetical protein